MDGDPLKKTVEIDVFLDLSSHNGLKELLRHSFRVNGVCVIHNVASTVIQGDGFISEVAIVVDPIWLQVVEKTEEEIERLTEEFLNKEGLNGVSVRVILDEKKVLNEKLSSF